MQLSTVFLAFFSVKCCFCVDIVPQSAYNISRSVELRGDKQQEARNGNDKCAISPAALSVAKKYDRLDSYSQAVVEAVVDLELARVNTLGGQTAVGISSDLPETERDHQGAEAAR